MENYDHSMAEQLINKLRPLIDARDFTAAARVFRAYEPLQLSAQMMVLKSTVIQLANDPAGYTLDDARNSLLHSVKHDPKFAEGWIELGHFYFAVDDNSTEALECFSKAEDLASSLHLQAVVGRAKALVDLDRKLEAAELLKEPCSVKWSIDISAMLREIDSQ